MNNPVATASIPPSVPRTTHRAARGNVTRRYQARTAPWKANTAQITNYRSVVPAMYTPAITIGLPACRSSPGANSVATGLTRR